MGQSKPFRPTALVVEDDPMQREMICLLLEESDLDVVECASAEAAALVLEQAGAEVALMMTDVNLAGHMDGVELAHIARKYNPDIDVIVTSGKPLRQQLPDGAKFWSKPWAPLDVIREAEKMSMARRCGRQGVGERSMASYPKMASCSSGLLAKSKRRTRGPPFFDNRFA